MATRSRLIGREAEVERLETACQRAAQGEGSVVLLCGEAGMGKTRLSEEIAAKPPAITLRGAAHATGQTAYAPVVTALRSHLRSEPEALAGTRPLEPHLALLMPELEEVKLNGLDEGQRTVDAHMRSILSKLECRSRMDATRRAANSD